MALVGTGTAGWPPTLRVPPKSQVLDSRATRAEAVIGVFQVRTVAQERGVTPRFGRSHPLCRPRSWTSAPSTAHQVGERVGLTPR